MKKLFASLIFGLLVLGLAPFSMMDAYAQSTLYGIGFFGEDGLSQLYTIDTTTGIAASVGTGIGFERCSAMDFHPTTGILYALCERDDSSDLSVLITINLITGVGTEVGQTFGEDITTLNFVVFTGMSFRNSDGALYAHSAESHQMVTIAITGQATDLGGDMVGCAGNAVAFTPADTLYLASCAILISIDQTTGNLASFVTSTEFTRMNGMDYDPETGVLFGIHKDGGSGGSNRFLVTIDVADFSSLTSVPTEDGMDAIAFLTETVIGGEFLPIDNTALILAGLQSSAIWMLPVLAGAAGIGAFYIKTRMNKE